MEISAPKIKGRHWFNSRPLTNDDLQGKIVLVDFWTYSCPNCARALPYLKHWWNRYQGYNFILLGIHAPKFAFEKKPANVQKAIVENEITWPVVLDGEHDIWHGFANKYWPAQYLLNQNQEIVYAHYGEGNYEETEKEIQSQIRRARPSIALPNVHPELGPYNNAVRVPGTAETHCGYERGFLYRQEFQKNTVFDYNAPSYMGDAGLALSGKFLSTSEYAESGEQGAQIRLKFHAKEVNLVMEPADEQAVVHITLDDKPIDRLILGKDASKTGKITIDESRMYKLIESANWNEGILKITAQEGGFRAYVFTFSGQAA